MSDNRTKRMPDENGYLIPGQLMHRLILSILVAIISIGGYMVTWGINDAAFKAQVLTELGWMKERVVEIGDDLDKHEDDLTHGN